MKNQRSLLLFVLLFCLSTTLNAQTSQEQIPLKAFEGYYTHQFQPGTDFFLQLTPTETGLKLRQLWDGKEIYFTRKNELEFEGVAGFFPLKFTKPSGGKITEMTAFGKDLWKRSNDYKPVSQTYAITKKELSDLVGTYKSRSSQQYIEFYIEDDSLMAKQVWNGKVHHMLAQSAVKFVSHEVGISVIFEKAGNKVASAALSTGEVLDKVNDSTVK